MQDKIDSLIKDLNEWSKNIGIPLINSIDNDSISFISNCSYSEINQMTLEDLNSNYFNIMKFISNLNSSIHELQTIVDYCESSINYIICDKILKMDTYAKNDIKVMYCIKNDNLCKGLLKIQIDSKSKLSYLKDRMTFFTKMTDMLDSIIKRKVYDRSN